MAEHSVVIIGGGPTGLMLAGELALSGVDVAIVERRSNQNLEGSRAGGLHSRTIELLDQRGIAERFLAEGEKAQVAHFHVPLDISDFPTRHNYGLALFQNRIESILADWVSELPVTVYRGQEAESIAQDESGVDVVVSGGSVLRANYLVGCDGGRSMVRKSAGIAFPGWDATTSWILAEAETAEEPKWGFHEDSLGKHAIGPIDGGKRVRLVLTEREINAGDSPTLVDLREALIAVYGTDFKIHGPTWISRFNDMTRQAAKYRDRRVVLAGDAAHVHPPLGGQGLNIGIHDAVNLGWKLAQVIAGISPASLLDTYHSERHPADARVLRNTMAQVALRRTDERTKALGEIVTEILTMDEPRKALAAEMSGLGLRYDLGDGHPMLGRRMPDLDLQTSTGVQRAFAFLHQARPVLFSFGGNVAEAAAPWADRVQMVEAQYDGDWEAPAVGLVEAPSAVLVRPDGYVAWVGSAADDSPLEALARWFGSSGTA